MFMMTLIHAMRNADRSRSSTSAMSGGGHYERLFDRDDRGAHLSLFHCDNTACNKRTYTPTLFSKTFHTDSM